MSYLALARKWRPKIFADVVGQEHIVRALCNALETNRVHHAYLFAGTRGVGKTTVARILAKALNCEEGVSGEPCGACAACIGIDEGRFIDLIEVDAASKTGVDDMRELLDNVQYAPSVGRYKVYLIDEVHMLSKSSFNALLKTLEEPPPHVKFLLATTDPQKMPITVLSRCLQFNLKRLSTTQIVERMNFINSEEKIEAEGAAITRIARAASGSMRDALSLLDQALAYGGGSLLDEDVASMLGSMDRRHINGLLQCLIDGDAGSLMEQVRSLHDLVPDYESVLDDLATLLQQISVFRLAGADALDEDADMEALRQFAGSLGDDLGDDMVQLYYQIAVTGRRDLGLAPDPRIGFEMTLLRMLAFRPAGSATEGFDASSNKSSNKLAGSGQDSGSAAAGKTAVQAVQADSGWSAMIDELKLTGAVRQLAENCALGARDERMIRLDLPGSNEYLLTDKLKASLTGAIHALLGAQLNVKFKIVDTAVDTVASRQVDESAHQLEEARNSIKNDPDVHELIEMFDATVEADSIRPVDRQSQQGKA